MDSIDIDITKMSYNDLGLLKARIEQAMRLERTFNQDKHKDWIGKIVEIEMYGDSKFYGRVKDCNHEDLILCGYDLGGGYIDSYSEESFKLDGNEDKIKEITKEEFHSIFNTWAEKNWENFWTGITEE